jgi:putative glutamine amidotransferase
MPIPTRATDRPVIGIAPDIVEPTAGSVRAQCALTYARAVADAGGLPFLLAPLPELIPVYLQSVDGFLLTGGDDPRTEPFGVPTHPKATPVHPQRQAFDTALLAALSARPDVPTLGICLGMQMMALSSGGSLNQHMPDNVPTHAEHARNALHPVRPLLGTLPPGTVTSHHRQAVESPGRLRVVATGPDGVIEAIDNPAARFFLGVQWHPERTVDPGLGVGILKRLVDAARRV